MALKACCDASRPPAEGSSVAVAGNLASSAERRDRWGDAVDPGFVRLAIGCEPAEDLWAAIDGALRGLP